ncbi:MAG: hypothetical protein AB8C95_11805 [Phycisphaeraceae bacterium]
MNKLLLIVLVVLMSASAAQACIWDRDTLAMERARFPEVNELIAGYFPRHSPPYYQWRIEQVQAIPIDQRKPADYDDLAVSYDKLGQHDQAIATMLAKVERFPNESIYETHANLGTFYIHNGDLEQGAQYIGSAIEINQDAHFGREVYQKLLVEYVIQQRAKGNTLPLNTEEVSPIGYSGQGFGAFVMEAQQIEDASDRQAEADRAIKGVLGMMRFGNYDSPILLEALGDLLRGKGFENAPQRLAVRAYLKASYETNDLKAVELYRAKAKRSIGSQEGVSLESIESKLREEIAKGDEFFDKIEEHETAWSAAGTDLDEKFNEKFYASEPALTQSIAAKAMGRVHSLPVQLQLLVAILGLILLCVVIAVVKPLLTRTRGNSDAA